LATERGRQSAVRATNRSHWRCAASMSLAVMVRHKRYVEKWMDFST
jgi:hypothetical protein